MAKFVNYLAIVKNFRKFNSTHHKVDSQTTHLPFASIIYKKYNQLMENNSQHLLALRDPNIKENYWMIGTESIKETYKKFAGNTAPMALIAGLILCGLSKEYLLFNEFNELFCFFAAIQVIRYKIMPLVFEKADQDYTERTNSLNAEMDTFKNKCIDVINHEKNQKKINTIRKNLVALNEDIDSFTRESEYRKKLNYVFQEYKRRLDYQVELTNLETRIQTEHVVSWVHDQVLKAITPEMEKKALAQSILAIKQLKNKPSFT